MNALWRLLPWLLLAAALVFAYFTRGILTPFLAGFAVGYLLDPVADRLEARGVDRGLAAGAIIVCVFLVAAGALAALWPMLQTQIVGLIRALPEAVAALQSGFRSAMLALAEEFGADVRQGAEGLVSSTMEDVLAGTGAMVQSLFAGGLAVFNLFALLLIAPVVAFYLLRDYDHLMARLRSLLPPRQKPAIVETVGEIDRVLAGFVRGQLLVALIMGVLYATGWSAIGLDYGLILGLLAGAMAIIPFVGMLAAAMLAVAVGFGQWGLDPVNLGLVAGVWLVVQTLEGTVLTPRLLGRHVGLHPVWVLFAIFAGGEIAGFVGVLLAVPAAAVVKVLVQRSFAHYCRHYGGPAPETALPESAGAQDAGPEEQAEGEKEPMR